MLTYNKGQWINDTSCPDDYVMQGSGHLAYEGFEKYPSMCLGESSNLGITVYQASSREASHQFFVMFETPIDRLCDVLVMDFPSLLMLIKEVSPLWNIAKDQERFEMQEEEHKWKANSEGVYNRECVHH